MDSTAHVTSAAYLRSLRADREWLAVVDPTTLGADVPGCPGWSVATLLAHLGVVHRFAMRGMATAPDATPAAADERPPEGEAVIGWLIDGLDRLVATFERSDLDQPCWTFLGPRNVGWWLRRETHETAIHRWDAESATRTPHPIDGALSVDGVDEWLEIQAARATPLPADVRGTIHLHATDGDGEWLFDLGDTLTSTTGHHKGDAAVRGPRCDLFLLVWGRIPPSRLELIGDSGLVERFLDSF